MSAFQDEFESDMSDNDDNNEEEVTAWLDEEDDEIEEEPVKPVVVEVVPKIAFVHKPPYIVNHLDLFFALCEVEDWEFENFTDDVQEEIMKTLILETFKPGDRIIAEGDSGNDLYIVVATEDTSVVAEVEVVNQNLLAGNEVFLTRLKRGQYFGQKYFLTRRSSKRGATVRVPNDSPCTVQIARLGTDHFDKWESFRNLLLVKTVPMIQKLPRKERSTILQNLEVREFKDGDYICTQGEQGKEFFIIQEGSVKVVERRPNPEGGFQDVVLVTLREGHFFGEMSLVTDEPRVANVISIKNTICLSLSKTVFRKALSDETFNEVLREALEKRKEIRKQREREETSSTSSPAPGGSNGSSYSRKQSVRARTSNAGMNEVNVSTTLSMKKLESGYRLINKYIVERELGKGSFGEVYLCTDQETKNQYAMKMINRPASSWNDEASNSIRQEIAVLKRLKHQNIVGLHEVIDDQNARKIFLIQEFMEGGPLMPDSAECDPIDPKLARKYFRDIVRGVCYLHSEGIIHRDIKPQNMLLSKDDMCKIADFGAAVFTGNLQESKVAFGGTPAFMAPELFLSGTAIDFAKSPGIDIFALGATLYFLVVGRPPWMAKNQIDLATKIKNIELTFPKENIDPHLKHLLRQMLAKDYRTRCNLDTIVIDDWVTFEGSEPLFEKDDYLSYEFIDYKTFLFNDDPFTRPIHALLVHDSFSIQTMLHMQINAHGVPTMTQTASSPEQAIEIITSCQQTHPGNNFEFIFYELLLPTLAVSQKVLKMIRDLGYTGIIIGMLSTMVQQENNAPSLKMEDTTMFIDEGLCNIVIHRPIAVLELGMILTPGYFTNKHDTKTASVDKVSLEEFEHAITFNAITSPSKSMISIPSLTSMPSVASTPTMTSEDQFRSDTPSTLTNNTKPPSPTYRRALSRTASRLGSSGESLDDDENLKDFDQDQVILNPKHLSINSLNDSSPSSLAVDANRLSINGENKGLSRKRGFMVVPYGDSNSGDHDPDHGSQDDDDANLSFNDRQLKIVNFRESKRRERREAAMQNSQAAHQFRIAKRQGDEISLKECKSVLHTLRNQHSRRNLIERKSTKSMHSMHSMNQSIYLHNPIQPNPNPANTSHYNLSVLLNSSFHGGAEGNDMALDSPNHSFHQNHHSDSTPSPLTTPTLSRGSSVHNVSIRNLDVMLNIDSQFHNNGMSSPTPSSGGGGGGSGYTGGSPAVKTLQRKQISQHNLGTIEEYSQIYAAHNNNSNTNNSSPNGSSSPNTTGIAGHHSTSSPSTPNNNSLHHRLSPPTIGTGIEISPAPKVVGNNFSYSVSSDGSSSGGNSSSIIPSHPSSNRLNTSDDHLLSSIDEVDGEDDDLEGEGLMSTHPNGEVIKVVSLKKPLARNIAVRQLTMDSDDEAIEQVQDGDDDDDDEDSDFDDLELTDDEIELIVESSDEEDEIGDFENDPIEALDDDAFARVFDDLIPKKEDKNKLSEVQEWNHIMVGIDFMNKLTCQEGYDNSGLGIKYGYAENIVSRTYMEDRVYVNGNIGERDRIGRTPMAMFSVFDGHNGHYVAEYLQDNYWKIFYEKFKKLEEKYEYTLMESNIPGYEARIAQIFEETSAYVDREILQKDFLKQQKRAAQSNLTAEILTFGGSVSVTAAIMPVKFASNHHHGSTTNQNTTSHPSMNTKTRSNANMKGAIQVFISHVGDCRAVLSHDGQAVQLTEDHKANVRSERIRIEHAGGFVQNGRVNGSLIVSRSFGDIQFKNVQSCLPGTINSIVTPIDELALGGIWHDNQQVISKPDFKHFIVESSYEFMILASDGLWDVFPCQDAVNFVRKKLMIHKNVNTVTQMLVEKAISLGTQDNTSVVVVAFHQL